MRILLLLLESAVQDKILAVLRSDEDATSLSDSRFTLKELRQSSIGKNCSRWHQPFIDFVDELVAKLQVGLGPGSVLNSGTVFHQNILNRAGSVNQQSPRIKTRRHKHRWGRLGHCSAMKR